ncbi:leucine-rich repeat-containing protein 27-like isoform X3 [Pseudochaenichthys georgianus]|uniref:leucine-rich repeat-containing protein 27-like isoform X3 n=1 Tax=Pseudochaenichthys georgianus TaxID=52239 RepID=UPI00146B4A33|nr:leucine-rich repeat-containing protein 27-like isoform X3 [Pseudochaenichthys georgianus]
MSSPEEEAPDLQLRFVFGNSVVKRQNPHILPEDEEAQEPPEHYSTETLCLSRTQRTHVAESILKNSTLKYLYLEGNQISSIPDSMFIRLPNLLWLDLRNNHIASFPAEIGLHRSLKTLLLEGNPISELPAEMGNVITLKGLNLRNCPITFPPQDIIDQGLQSILQHLRRAMAQRPVRTKKNPPELPVVEKLQLSELMGSSTEEQDESVDEDEMKRFRELKQKMILLDKAELGSTAQGDGNQKPPLLPIVKRSHDALNKWRTEAKTTQKKKMSEQKKRAEQRNQEEAVTHSKPSVEDGRDSSHSKTPGMSITQFEETRSARELQQQICARVEKMQERRRNPRGTVSEQMAVAEKDVEEMRKLQAQLLQRIKNGGIDLQKHLTIVTGDNLQSVIDK